MKELDIIHRIEEAELDQESYFQSFFAKICERNLMEDEQIKRIQSELVQLLAKETERYTGGESSSISIETAQQLLQSICYHLSVYLKSIPDINQKIELLKKENVSELFYHGMDRIISYRRESEALLKLIQEKGLTVKNYAYHDTVYHGIPDFFHDYNMEFAAQDNPGSIDYPLGRTIEKLTGIEFIREYLKRIWLENEFCMKFPPRNIEMLLYGFHNDHVQMLINIFELVLTNALGCALTGSNIFELNISSSDREWLMKLLEHKNKEELFLLLTEALMQIKEQLGTVQIDEDYYHAVIRELAVRLKHSLDMNTLSEFFLSFSDTKPSEEHYLEEGLILEDEALRKLIEEIKNCRYVSDKIAFIQSEVHSLTDLIVILEECFFEDEFYDVYDLLDSSERGILRKMIEDGMEEDSFYGEEGMKEWKKRLLLYCEERKEKK